METVCTYTLRCNDVQNQEAIIEWAWRYTMRPWQNKLRDALRGRDWPSLEIHSDCPWLCNLGGCNWDCLETHMEAMVNSTLKCTLRPELSEFGIHLEAMIYWSSEEYLEAVVARRTWCWNCIHQLGSAEPLGCYTILLFLSSHAQQAGGNRSWIEAPRNWNLNLSGNP